MREAFRRSLETCKVPLNSPSCPVTMEKLPAATWIDPVFQAPSERENGLQTFHTLEQKKLLLWMKRVFGCMVEKGTCGCETVWEIQFVKKKKTDNMWFLSCPYTFTLFLCLSSLSHILIWFMHYVPGVCGALVKLRDWISEIQPLWSYHIWTYYLSSLSPTEALTSSHVTPLSSEPQKGWREYRSSVMEREGERLMGIINNPSTKICLLLWLLYSCCTTTISPHTMGLPDSSWC